MAKETSHLSQINPELFHQNILYKTFIFPQLDVKFLISRAGLGRLFQGKD